MNCPDNDLCNALRSVGKGVFDWVSKQPSVGEESLTDWILYETSRRSSQIRYRKFNRHQEAKETGADWEWWFVGNDGAVALRVQAKKLFDAKDNYQGFAYTNRSGLQIEMLMEAAKQRNCIPVYALYSAPHKHPNILCGMGPLAVRGQGIFIAGAKALYTAFVEGGRRKVNADDALSHSNPMMCLACCPLSEGMGKGGTVKGVLAHLRRYYFTSEDYEQTNQGFGYHEATPDYIRSLMDMESGAIPDWWEREFASEISYINAIVTVDMRCPE